MNQPQHNLAAQGTDEWFRARKGMITGSRVGAILGVSPFATRDAVMREMVREHFNASREFTGNVATAWGNENEDNALMAVEQQLSNLNAAVPFIASTGFHVHPKFEWLGASPDGLLNNFDRVTLVEVKCPWNRKITSLETKPHYMAQIQLQMHVTGAEDCWFAVWTPDDFEMKNYPRNDEWLDDNLPALTKFHDEYIATIADENLYATHLEDLEDARTDLAWYAQAQDYLEITAQAAALKKKADEAKAALIELAAGKKCRGAGVLVYPTKARVTTNYKKLVDDVCPDADVSAYQKTGAVSWSIRAQ